MSQFRTPLKLALHDNRGNGTPFAPGTNSQDGTVHRRGPDLIPRETVASLYRAILDDDGTLEASLKGDKRLRARLLRALIRCIDDPKHPRNAVFAAEAIADRLEGRPVQKVEGLVLPQAVFYDASGPIPPGVTPPVAERKAPQFELLE